MKKRKGSSSNSYGDMMNCTPSELFLQKIQKILDLIISFLNSESYPNLVLN